jgi:hypothetical protein
MGRTLNLNVYCVKLRFYLFDVENNQAVLHTFIKLRK